MRLWKKHVDRAHEMSALRDDDIRANGLDLSRAFYWALLDALIAGVVALGSMALELRRIRKILESGRITAIGLKANTTPKEGDFTP